MERLRILAAAAALREFTVAELVAFGANDNTVRSVLRREGELFEAVAKGGSRRAGKGRPAAVFRAVDLDRIRREVQELERVTAIVPQLIEPRSDTESEQDRLVPIVVAEDAALRAWRAELPEEKVVLAQSARRSLGQAKLADAEGVRSAELTTRAQSVAAFAALAESEAHGQANERAFARAWSALADYADVVAPERAREVMAGLGDLAVRHDQLPPLAVLTDVTVTPAEALPELGAGWIRVNVDEAHHETLWAQKWAESLVEHKLVYGLVVHNRFSGAEFELSLGRVADWRPVPAVVISDEVSAYNVSLVSRAGAFSIPASEGFDAVAETLRSAFANLHVDKVIE